MPTPPSAVTFFEAVDPRALAREYPAGPAFLERFAGMSADALHARQDALFRRAVARAWQIPFYQRLWDAAGVAPGDIGSLADIGRLPTFGKDEVMASVARRPPFGDHHGREVPVDGRILPMIVHTTSGTTGTPQPLIYSPKTREVQNLLLARIYLLQGLRADDVVHSVYGHGLVNGGHYIREVVTRHTPAVFLSAGTGIETPSAKQVELMRDFGVTVLAGFGDFLKRLAQVAREQGIDPVRDIGLRMITGHLSDELRASLGAAWGPQVELFDWYGVGDTGAIAGEGPDHDGLYLQEDAQYVEINDVETGRAVAPGEVGDMVVTCLFIDDLFPIIRFNTHDITRVLPGTSALGLPFRRIAGFLGRSDSMVKLKGINVYPQAIGNILAELDDFAGEYVCVRGRAADGGETFTVRIETRAADPGARLPAYRDLLKRRLGVEVTVSLEAPKSLSALTGVESRQKPVRLVDQRGAA
ncbi:MAG: phenylacetate--CoA ligase family protein [Burkholderiales bacterium]|nr:phenylacetate--CoA ligase family protein [Burkholderiales bacterium]